MTVDGLEKKEWEPCGKQCRLDEQEREWVHTASKYIDTKHLPMLGRTLKLFDDTSAMLGRWIILAIILGGMSIVFLFIKSKWGLR